MEIMDPEIEVVAVAQSPTPKPRGVLTPATMSFYHAMKQVAAGKKIHKLEWVDKEYYGFLNGDILSIHKPDNVNYQWIINKGDLVGEDWVVI